MSAPPSNPPLSVADFAKRELSKRPAFERFSPPNLQAILAQGGSRPAAELFREFMGRDPSAEALLRHTGLSEAVEAA